MYFRALVTAGVLYASSLFAAPMDALSFNHKSWQVDCNANGDCRATGHGEEKDSVSLRLSRAGDVSAGIRMQVVFADSRISAASLLIDGQPAGELQRQSALFIPSRQQHYHLLNALREDKPIAFKANNQRLALSSAGSTAVLLKMDVAQQRSGTPGALLPSRFTAEDKQTLSENEPAIRKLEQAATTLRHAGQDISITTLATAFPVKRHVTEFILNDTVTGTTPKPSADISDDEWQAFVATAPVVESENGRVNYRLIDLDGDGRRDLIIDTYSGGTGLFSYTGVMRRSGNLFRSDKADKNGEFLVPGEFYSEMGRGANQGSAWVEIAGQVYALWFEGAYGKDTFWLLRPFITPTYLPTLAVRYSYSMTLVENAPELSESEKKALITSASALWQFNEEYAPPETVCPVPPGTPADQVANFSTGMVGHYTVEKVAVFPVWIKGECRIVTAFGQFGYHSKADGVTLTLGITSVNPEQQDIANYTLRGKRKVEAISSSWLRPQ